MILNTIRFFFCNGARLNAKNWLIVEQALKKTKLNIYKVYNITAARVMENSIFKISKLTINGVTLLVVSNEKNLNVFTKNLDTAHTQIAFMSLIINNKIYSNLQIKVVNPVSYFKNLLIFCRVINRNYKTAYLNSIFFRNSVI